MFPFILETNGDYEADQNLNVPVLKTKYTTKTTTKNFSSFFFLFKVNTEYYLFSSFGVLHVDKDLQSETFRLTEWQRHAVLWEAIHEIPFFKNYLISKMFYR